MLKMELYFLALFVCSTICITISIRYEVEFLDEEVFIPCENYPNNSFESVMDISNLKIKMTEEGSIDIKGYTIITKSTDTPTPLSIEVFKKVRGTWQPTIYNQKRPDACTAVFGSLEMWHSYFRNTPKEQMTCPFREGQRVDLNISDPTYIYIPFNDIVGEYKTKMEIGRPNSNFYICTNIYASLYKI